MKPRQQVDDRSVKDIFVNAAGQIFIGDGWSKRIVRINDMTGAGWTTFSPPDSGTN